MCNAKYPQPKPLQLQTSLFVPGTNITVNSNRLEKYL